jgi:calcyphosin
MNAKRSATVDKAFAKLDRTGDGLITVEDLLGVYDGSYHPKFKSGEMTQRDVLNEFLAQWDTHEKDGKVTRAEF